ncbi:MAG: hypothetical protein OXC41_01760 [Gammaproteobacteria bacterium]|nr:hypothetical protein [Gammaproteobacteria bacterium]
MSYSYALRAIASQKGMEDEILHTLATDDEEALHIFGKILHMTLSLVPPSESESPVYELAKNPLEGVCFIQFEIPVYEV